MLVHRFSIDGFPHLVEVFEARGANKVLLRKIVRGQSVELLRSELEPCATLAGNLLRELGRLATAREAKSEQVPDGSRTFEADGAKWRIYLGENRPYLFKVLDGGGEIPLRVFNSSSPHVDLLLREFAALGREQEATRVEPLLRQARDEAARLREESQGNASEYIASSSRFFRDAEELRAEVADLRVRLEESRKIGLAEKTRADGLVKRLAGMEATLADRMENFAAGCAAGAAAVTKAIMGADAESSGS